MAENDNIDPGTGARSIPRASIRCEAAAWPRQELDQGRVGEFVTLYADDEPCSLPPLDVVADADGSFVLADGWHRLAAQRALGRTEILARVHLRTGIASAVDIAY